MEEIQGKQERQQNQQRSELEQEEEANKARVAEPPSSSSLGRAVGGARSGALLVEVYGRVVRKQHNSFSPNQVLFDFTRYLVSFCIDWIFLISYWKKMSSLTLMPLCSLSPTN